MKRAILLICRAFSVVFEMTGKCTFFILNTIGEEGWTWRKTLVFLLLVFGPITFLNGEKWAESWVRSAHAYAPSIALALDLDKQEYIESITYPEIPRNKGNDALIVELDLTLADGNQVWLSTHTYDIENFFGLLALSNWKHYPAEIKMEVFKIAFCESTLDPSKIQEYKWRGKLRKDVGFLGIWEEHTKLLGFHDYLDLTDGLTNLNAGEKLYRLRGGWFPSWKASKQCFLHGPTMDQKEGRDGWQWGAPIFTRYLIENKQLFVSN